MPALNFKLKLLVLFVSLGSNAILSSHKLNPHEAQRLNQFEKTN